MPNLTNRSLYFAFFIIIFLTKCDLNKNQINFEQEAFRTPSGITSTDIGGNILSGDPDDWRISPLFINSIEILRPAYPNPASNQTITIEFLVTSLDSVTGLIGYVLRADGSLSRIGTYRTDTLPVGTISVQIDPIVFSIAGNLMGAKGLHRVLFYDIRDRIITYGDVQID